MESPAPEAEHPHSFIDDRNGPVGKICKKGHGGLGEHQVDHEPTVWPCSKEG